MIRDDYERPTSGSKGERIIISCEVQIKREPRHEKKKQQNECAPSEDSDQAGHPPSLIRVFAVRMKKPWVLTCSYPSSAQRRL